MINANIQIPELTGKNFESHLQGKTVLVDFWAEWCHPCKEQHKMLKNLAFEYDYLFEVASVNIDSDKWLASSLQVSSIPALILFSDGKEIKRFIGLQQKEILIKEIEKYIKKNNRSNE
jgi:thioredoxin 1